jgi:hypothetical protein
MLEKLSAQLHLLTRQQLDHTLDQEPAAYVKFIS